MNAPARRRMTIIDVTATVDIDDIADDLEDAGWHHADDCPAAGSVGALDNPPDLRDALASLHRQAHPSQGREPASCREEPCRSLPVLSLTGRLK